MSAPIQFCRSFDGTRIAYCATGEGLPVLRAPTWLTHVEYEARSPVWKGWIEAFSREHRLIRMDERGCGLSDREVPEIGFEAFVRDLEAVADAAGLERFALFGHSQGAALSIEYAARHPERVSHLVILGGYRLGAMKRGLPPERVEELLAQLKLVEAGWGRDDASYRQMFASQFIPDCTLEVLQAMSELQRVSASPEVAVRIVRALFEIDITGSVSRVRCPALVLHGRSDVRSPFEGGRELASRLPDARFVTLETRNHILVPGEPAFARFFEELRAFLPRGTGAGAEFAQLTAREAEVLERLAQGLDNAQIAAHLGISEKTVRNNVTHIFDKLCVENRSQAIVLARERGLGRG